MSKDILTVTVSGETNTGKTHLIHLLKEFLKDNNFDVVFNGDSDYNNEVELNKYVNRNLSKVIQHIKDNKKIEIREVNTFKKPKINTKL